MPRPITVRLIGGLGNQLFGYYAGAALAARHHTTLRLDTSWTRHGITDHGIEILNLDLPGEWLPSDSLRAKLAAPGTEPGHLPAGHVSDDSNTCSSVRRPADIVKPHMPAIHSPHPQRTTTTLDRTPSPSK